jgi:hypothetical protein
MSETEDKSRQSEVDIIAPRESEVRPVSTLRRLADLPEMDWDDDGDYSPSAEHATIMRVQQESAAINMIVEAARRESLSEDIDYCRDCLQKFARAIKEKKITPPLRNQVLYFPLPRWNNSTSSLDTVVRHLNTEAEPEISEKLLEEMIRLPAFIRPGSPFVVPREAPSLEERINYLKAVTIYCEELTGVKADAEEGMGVNYEQAIKTLNQTPFIRPPEGFEHYREYDREMVADHFKILQFKACLRWYMESKTEEMKGRIAKGKAISRIGLNPLLGKSLDIPENSEEEIDSKYVPALERWLKRAIKGDIVY